MEITINLGNRSYPIILDKDISGRLPSRLKSDFPKSKFAIVTNTTINKLYSELIGQWQSELNAVLHIIPDGEQYKNVKTWSEILDTLLNAKLERSSIVIAFGGGVVGDMTGFAASVLLRGVKYIQVPTTLLSMVDSSVGGKTAVDHSCGKNLIGAFHQPSLVYIDTSLLDTLPFREYISGYAELYKYAFIGGREMFDFIKTNHNAIINKDSSKVIEGIERSIRIKAKIVELDEFETKDLRALLNFGHTFAHALEKHFNFQSVLHGEAVLWGIKCAFELGKETNSIPYDQMDEYTAILKDIPLPDLPSRPDSSDLLAAMFSDKKIVSGKLRFVLPEKPGASLIRSDISEKQVISALNAVFL
jgi:3-dehydroquinate synthase